MTEKCGEMMVIERIQLPKRLLSAWKEKSNFVFFLFLFLFLLSSSFFLSFFFFFFFLLSSQLSRNYLLFFLIKFKKTKKKKNTNNQQTNTSQQQTPFSVLILQLSAESERSPSLAARRSFPSFLHSKSECPPGTHQGWRFARSNPRPRPHLHLPRCRSLFHCLLWRASFQAASPEVLGMRCSMSAHG